MSKENKSITDIISQIDNLTTTSEGQLKGGFSLIKMVRQLSDNDEGIDPHDFICNNDNCHGCDKPTTTRSQASTGIAEMPLAF